MATSGDRLDCLFFLLLNNGLPAGQLEGIVAEASGKQRYAKALEKHWLSRKARELAWRIRLPGLLNTSEVTLRRLDDALAGFCSTDPEIIADGLRAVQSLDDLGTPEANLVAHAWMQELQSKLGDKR